ncbi:MAG TPA: HAD-IB family hydrolase [Nostocaceae cyanobacterium]|nr:HAD-IB family hydrolase [Nostocaceae cyanobacterium]
MKVAALDIDGTLYPGALGLKLLQALTANGISDKSKSEDIFKVVERYRLNEIDFQTMATTAYTLCAEAIAGISQAVMQHIARQVWQQERTKLFPFVPQLIEVLKSQGYSLVLISGSPDEIVCCLAEEFGISKYQGSIFATHQGKYTGQVSLLSGALGKKYSIFSQMVKDWRVNLEESLAIGDSITDTALLQIVGKPVVFEPHPSLMLVAQEKGWLVTNRNDVVKDIMELENLQTKRCTK